MINTEEILEILNNLNWKIQRYQAFSEKGVVCRAELRKNFVKLSRYYKLGIDYSTYSLEIGSIEISTLFTQHQLRTLYSRICGENSAESLENLVKKVFDI